MVIDKSKNIKVGGTLHSISTGNIIAHADEIMDESWNDGLGAKLSIINQELKNNENSINVEIDKITSDLNLEVKNRGDANTTINNRINLIVSDLKTYSISVVPLSELEANVREAFKLIDEDGVLCGELINVYKDSSLLDVSLQEQKLVFTYTLENGSSKVVEVDISTFLAESEFGNGLLVLNHIVSIKKDTTSENFLLVSSSGIKVTGILNAINLSKNETVTDYTDKINVLTTNLNKEILDRKDEISIEITNRTTADSTLLDNINSEETSRIMADNLEKSAREEADNAILENLNNEILNRINSDELINNLISDIDNKIDNEIQNRITADNTKVDKVTGEGLIPVTMRNALSKIGVLSHIDGTTPWDITENDVRLSYSNIETTGSVVYPHLGSIGAASTTKAGVMTAADRKLLNCFTYGEFTEAGTISYSGIERIHFKGGSNDVNNLEIHHVDDNPDQDSTVIIWTIGDNGLSSYFKDGYDLENISNLTGDLFAIGGGKTKSDPEGSSPYQFAVQRNTVYAKNPSTHQLERVMTETDLNSSISSIKALTDIEIQTAFDEVFS